MRKGKVSIHIAEVKKVMADHSILIQTGDMGDLSDEVVAKQIEKVNK